MTDMKKDTRSDGNQASTPSVETSSGTGRSIKQFLFLRSDLEGFTTGSLVAQGCHASVAALEKYRHTPQVVDYVKHLGSMTTVVYEILGSELEAVVASLDEMGIGHHCWLEGGVIPTCIATWPIDIEVDTKFKKFRRRFRLFGNMA